MPSDTKPTKLVGNESDAGDLFCPDCGYDLRGIASERCPECGLTIDRAAMSVSRIPWVHRRKIGRFKAYWRTTRLAMFHPRRLAEEMNRPVELSDARRFWQVTVLLAWVPLTAWVIGLLLSASDVHLDDFRQGTRLGWCLEGAVVLVCLFAIWLFLLMASGSVSYWFHPRQMPVSRQNRAITLSFYTCAPLGWLWLPALLGAVALLLDYSTPAHVRPLNVIEVSGYILAISLAFGLLAGCGINSVLLIRHVTHCGPGRSWAMTLSLPLMWAILAVVAALIPLAVLMVSLAILSLR